MINADILYRLAVMLFLQFIFADEPVVSSHPSPSIQNITPISDDNGITITSLAVHFNSTRNSWSWLQGALKSHEGDVGCVIQMYGLLQYKMLPNFSHACNGNIFATARNGSATQYRGIDCFSRTAWKLADGKYGNDGNTVSMVIGCLAQRSTHLEFCQLLNHSTMDITVVLHSNESFVSAAFEYTSILHRAMYRVERKTSYEKGRPELAFVFPREKMPRFAVCAVQTNRNPLSPYYMHMFVAHYLNLGFHVILYDRFGFHVDYIREFMSNPRFDYHPYTLLEIAWPKSVDRNESFDFRYKLYYSKESDSVSQSVPTVHDTYLQDRDKMVTLDHATVEYSMFPDIRGILFVDIDEYLFCPAKNVSRDGQSRHIYEILDKELTKNKEEMRIDVHPYSASQDISGSVNSIASCFKDGFAEKEINSLSYLRKMHDCFSGKSTYQMWPKSLDFRRRCPFHYNHW